MSWKLMEEQACTMDLSSIAIGDKKTSTVLISLTLVKSSPANFSL